MAGGVASVEELENVKKLIPKDHLLSAFPSMVQVKIARTPWKIISGNFLFPPEYPASGLHVDFKSHTVDPRLLDKLSAGAMKEAEKYLGGEQVVAVYKWLLDIVNTWMLSLVAFPELLEMKKMYKDKPDVLKLWEKKGIVRVRLTSEEYFVSVLITIPDKYPDEKPLVAVNDSNFPETFQSMFAAQMDEIARVAIEGGPLKWIKVEGKTKQGKMVGVREKHVIRPSLLDMVKFLDREAVEGLPRALCGLCSVRVFPDKPEEYVEPKEIKDRGDGTIIRAYCGHVFHFGCLNQYMKEPPFPEEGKPCTECNRPMNLPGWTSNMGLRKARWEHKEARRREVGEVAEFLGL